MGRDVGEGAPRETRLHLMFRGNPDAYARVYCSRL